MVKVLLSSFLAAVSLQAASFTLGATIEAGSASAGANELFVGSTSGSSSSAASVSPYWSDGGNNNYNFSLSYNGATNTATLQAQTGVSPTSVSWLVAGGSVNPGVLNWTIAAGGLRVIAVDNDDVSTQVRIRNLSISGAGFTTLSPPNLLASQNGGGTDTAGNAAPITFSTPAGSGSWVLSGDIRFVGLASATPNGASGNQLRMAFDILASEQVPEPATLLMGALGLAALGVLHHFRNRRSRRGVPKA